MLSNIIVELPWNSLMAVILFFTWYYPIGFFRNAVPTGQVHERGALMFLLIWEFLLFASTFTHMVIAGLEDAETAGNLANLAFSLLLIFCGVLAGISPSLYSGFMCQRLTAYYRADCATWLLDIHVPCVAVHLSCFGDVEHGISERGCAMFSH